MSYVALIPAAGAGARMGAETPKQYLALAGRPMLYHSVRCVAVPPVETVFVVLAAGDEAFAACDWSEFDGRLEPLYCGGETRSETVYNGLVAAMDAVDADDWVLVHDAARPCLPRADLERLIAEVSNDRIGGLLALPVADTVKHVRKDEGGAQRVAGTHDRSLLWLAQTPQMFRAGLLAEALRSAKGGVTDEASAVEQMGLQPRLVAGSRRNLKVTYPEDLAIAEAILGSTVREPQRGRNRAMRIGQGFDVHALVAGRKLIVGGVHIPCDKGLAGHSDADVLIHAICDALLGAAGLGDIGRHFPDSEARYEGADSRVLLRAVGEKVAATRHSVANIDATIIAQAPLMAPHVAQMVANIAADLGVPTGAVNVKATTTEHLGFAGRGEGIAAQAIALLDAYCD